MISVLYTSMPSQVSDAEMEPLINLLTPKLRQRLGSYRSPVRRQSHIYGRILLLELSRRRGLESRLESLTYGPAGKPVIPGGPGISISHSGHLVACAISERSDVGLDIEAHRNVVIDDFRPWFSPDELQYISSCNSPSRELIRLWTMKEAVYKAGGIEAESVLPASEPVTGPVSAGELKWYLYPLELESGYEATLACSEADVRISLEYIPDVYL